MTDSDKETNDHNSRITELETRIAFLEETVETQNQEVARMAGEVRVMKEALQMVYKKVSDIEGHGGGISNPADEPPPPHY